MTRAAAALALACAALAGCQTSPAVGPSHGVGSAKKGVSAADFLAGNARAPGVVTVPGLEYKVVSSGPADGPHPKRSDDVTVQYEGRLLSGEVFDSSAKRGEPVTFELGRLIPGWVIGLQLMRPGDEWMLYVPPQLAYGYTDRGTIPAGSVLVFRVKLIGVAPHPKPPGG